MTAFSPVFHRFFGILNKVLGKSPEENLEGILIGKGFEHEKTPISQEIIHTKTGSISKCLFIRARVYLGVTFLTPTL